MSGARKSTSPAKGSIFPLLRRRILNWQYPPGYHLAEQTLCEEFSVSRIPVREALRALAEQGLVEKVPNQGCYVKQPDVQEIYELYEMRLALELFVGEMLVQRGLPEPWHSAERAFWAPFLEISADRIMDAEEFVQADTKFHLGLATAAGNERIVSTLRELDERLRFVRLGPTTTPHRYQETAGGHLAILDAIVAKDIPAVRRTLRQNINHARNKVELAIGRALMNAHQRRSPVGQSA